MLPRRLLAIVAVGCLLAGCGSADSTPLPSVAESASSPSVSAEAGRLSEPDCADEGACQSGFVFDGAFYAYACAGVRAEFVTGEMLASGDVGGRSISISEVAGIEPGLMIAVDFSANECFRDRDDEGESGWSVAFRDGADTEQLAEALCEVGEGRTALRDCTDGQHDATAAQKAEPEPTPVEATDPEIPPIIEDVLPEGGCCGGGFALGEHGFHVSCGAVSADAVTDEVLGTGELRDDPAEARAIAGVGVDVAVAVNRPGGDCLEGDPLGGVLSDWSFAFAHGADTDASQHATCTVGAITPTQQLASRCHNITGDRVVSCGDTPVFPEWVLTSLADLTPAGPALGPSLDVVMADRPEADRQGWRLITDIEVGEVFHYLMLRDTGAQVDYLLTTGQTVLAGPASCEPEPG